MSKITLKYLELCRSINNLQPAIYTEDFMQSLIDRCANRNTKDFEMLQLNDEDFNYYELILKNFNKKDSKVSYIFKPATKGGITPVSNANLIKVVDAYKKFRNSVKYNEVRLSLKDVIRVYRRLFKMSGYDSEAARGIVTFFLQERKPTFFTEESNFKLYLLYYIKQLCSRENTFEDNFKSKNFKLSLLMRNEDFRFASKSVIDRGFYNDTVMESYRYVNGKTNVEFYDQVVVGKRLNVFEHKILRKIYGAKPHLAVKISELNEELRFEIYSKFHNENRGERRDVSTKICNEVIFFVEDLIMPDFNINQDVISRSTRNLFKLVAQAIPFYKKMLLEWMEDPELKNVWFKDFSSFPFSKEWFKKNVDYKNFNKDMFRKLMTSQFDYENSGDRFETYFASTEGRRLQPAELLALQSFNRDHIPSLLRCVNSCKPDVLIKLMSEIPANISDLTDDFFVKIVDLLKGKPLSGKIKNITEAKLKSYYYFGEEYFKMNNQDIQYFSKHIFPKYKNTFSKASDAKMIEFAVESGVKTFDVTKMSIDDLRECSRSIMNLDIVRQFVEKITDDTEKFKEKNKDGILDFYFRNNIDNVMKYISRSGISNSICHSMLLAAKSEVMGKFKEFKYFGNSISEEMEEVIEDDLKEKWKNILSKGNVCEDDTFETSFYIGVTPTSTCMSYKDGAYAQCLPSFFDSTKKLIVAKDNDGKIKTRSILRFTKYTNESLGKEKPKFVDMEKAIEKANPKEFEAYTKCLFFERVYGDLKHTGNMIKLAAKKAEEMGLKLIITNKFDVDTLKKHGIDSKPITMNIFINHSKNGNQYLDSFSGSSDENSSGGIYKGMFLEYTGEYVAPKEEVFVVGGIDPRCA